jgi:hypothetical protein
MKKILVVAIALIASVSSFAQTTLTPESAAKWFKDNYVDQNFKDPYSYKLANLSIDTLTVEKQIISRIKMAEDDLANIAQKRKDAQWSIETGNKYVKKGQDPNGTWAEAIQRGMKKIEELNALPQTIEKMKSDLATMSESDKKKPYSFFIYIDSHANNSYGGTVLGKYVFCYKNGEFLKESVYKRN